MLKRILLLLCFFSFLCGNNVYAQFAGGSGTEEDPYQISTVEELQEIRNHTDKHFIQINDIDASVTETWNGGEGFIPIGDFHINFTGTYNGNSNFISNLHIDQQKQYMGLFGYANGAAFLNITLLDVYIKGLSETGGLLGMGANQTEIISVHVSGEISGNFHVGGLVGRMFSNGVIIKNSSASASVMGTNSNVGGLVGSAYQGEIIRSYATGPVIGYYSVGGLVGHHNSNATIENSYAHGAVSGVAQVGGLVGVSDTEAVILNSYSIGKTIGDEDVGGFIGINAGQILNSYWNKISTEQSSGSGRGASNGLTGLATFQMQGASAEMNMPELDWANTWAAIPNDYPKLLWSISYTSIEELSFLQKISSGQNFEVQINLKNKGGLKDTTDVVLKDSAGTVVDITESVILEPEEETSLSLQWQTTEETEGMYDFILKTRYDRDSFSVEVLKMPSKVEITSPAIEAQDIALLPELTWNEASLADYYQLQLSTNNAFDSLVIEEDNLDSFTFSVTDSLDYLTEYFWRVRASSSIGEGEWSDTTSFTTIIEKSEVTQLLSPVNDTTDVSITPTLTWSSAERAEDYQVQASTDSTFETILYDVSEIDSLNYQMETLDFNTVYYWRLKASNVGGESDWSENWSFFTEYALDKPVAETPINEAIDVEIPARFEWKPIDGADDYLLQLSKDENFESEIGLSEHTDAELQTTQNRLAKSISEKSWNISQTVEGLDFSTKYFWRVKAINNEGHSSWSQTQFFTTQDAPIEGIVNLTSPSHNSEDVDFPVELTWDEFTEAKYYNLELSESPAFDATISVRDLEATSFETSQLSDTTTYYWRVRASVDEQLTAWSAIWSFKTVLGIPEVPTWTPENEAEDVSQTPFISWGSSKRATTFDFQISKADDFSEIIFEAENLESTNIKIENKLESRTKYYWHVRANNQSGSSNWSETLSFITVLEKPDSVQLLIPQKDEWYPIDNPYFEWTSSEQADEYVFHLSKEEDFESFVLDTIITAPDTSFTMDEYLEADVFYYWRVKAANESGESEWSEVFDFLGNGGLSTETETLPTEFTLQQNYPNPFNPTTQIRYGIPNAAEVRLEVFNMLGQKVSTLVKERKSAGWHNATFDASELSSGFYIYRIQAGEFISTKKLLLIK